MDLQQALSRYFAFPNFRPGQETALRHVLSGRDTLVVMPTGSGKSLVYQLAALLLPGTTLVISPLIALMKDQIDGLARRGIAATFINSSLDSAQQAHRLRALADGQYKIVLAAPERLRSQAFLDALAHVRLSLLAVDEAHCLSQWGHDFRPDYLHIAEARARFTTPVTLALTATATPQVQNDIIDLLGLSHAERIVTGFNRPNLALEVCSAPDVKAKLERVRDLLAATEGAGIIYTGTRRDAEEVAEFVREVAGFEARHYHGALEPDVRATTQDAFLAGDLPIVVATNAFGMGIDRPDVRLVLHYTMPGTLEAYYQEAGRAGRDGLPARAILLYSPKDTALQEFFIENGSPSVDDLRKVYVCLRRSSETDPNDIERTTGLPEIKARVALEHLEIAGAVRRLPDTPRGRIRVETLPLLESALQTVAAQVAARREHKHRQLEIMVDYAETNACRRRAILEHFGDTGSAEAVLCCDNCLSRLESVEAESRPAQTQAERAALIVLDTVARLKWTIGRSKLAQILKGSAAKAITRLNYDKVRNYGKFAALRVADIESLIGQLIDSGYLKQVGSDQPTLKLTPRGETALKARSAIRVDLRMTQPDAARRIKAQREAGGAISLTGQLLARGLSPEQIAAERGVTPGTIYSHLARLIADGAVSVDAVVPIDVQQLVRSAIEQAGSADYLAPIKALLPDTIDYGVIRCVVEAWKREQMTATPEGPEQTATNLSGTDRAAHVHALGESGSLDHVPELITALTDPNGNVRRLAASALGKLRAVAAVEPLLALLEREMQPQVRQYAVKALGKIADVRVRSILERISRDPAEARYNRVAANSALESLLRHRPAALPRGNKPTVQSTSPHASIPPHDPVAEFLTRSHPRPLAGPWLAGWALDFHSRFDGDRQIRSVVGELAFRYKYGGERDLAAGLTDRWVALLAAHPELPKPDAVIPIPPSTRRDFDPVAGLAESLAARLGIPARVDVLVKTRATQLQKAMTALAQKRANVAGAFALKGRVRGQRLILVDDMYDSGMTLEEAARVLTRGGAASLIVLTLTKTIHADA